MGEVEVLTVCRPLLAVFVSNSAAEWDLSFQRDGSSQRTSEKFFDLQSLKK